MEVMYGKEVASVVYESIKEEVDEIKKHDISIGLCVIQVGDDKASSVYIKNKQKACDYVGIESMVINLNTSVTTQDVIAIIKKLNKESDITGILVQLPLPCHLDEKAILETIAPEKDVDGFNCTNAGKLFLGNDAIYPCTANGIMMILDYYNVPIEGKNCVVVGRSNIVGKPVAMLLLNKNATVTVCHSHTENLKDVCRNADILICATGMPEFFNEDYVKEGAVVIDVGITVKKDGKLCGDVDFNSVKDKASYITPVPGGVGPMTVAMLVSNCVEAVKKQNKYISSNNKKGEDNAAN